MSKARQLSPVASFAGLQAQDADLYALALTPDRHPESLNRLAARALGRHETLAAYAFADRRCRIRPVPLAQDFLLRAEASRRLGDDDGAADDVRTARERDPIDPLVNQQALRCRDGEKRLEAATALVASPRANATQIGQAITVLDAADRCVLARLDVGGSHITGWASWPRGEALTCTVTDASSRTSFRVEADNSHPLATGTRCAAGLAMPRLRGQIQVRLTAASPILPWEITVASDDPEADRACLTLDGRLSPALLVVVPVYDDVAATVACLDSLKTQHLPRGEIAVVVVDDASPNPRITAELDARAAREEFRLIRNPHNLGFAASVNRACSLTNSGDILLLNADTLLPPQVIARMLEVLASHPEAGTVTPLSNNGELTSFPVAFEINPLPDPADLRAWDAAAARVGAPALDLPNGIGFCMLVRRQCWDALGGIAQIYGRGYYEDVDLCLRARDLGYRNLCATNVVVGHAGSRSFKSEKRALVIRNLETLRSRFPRLEAESAAFSRAQPLRGVFSEIERRIAPPAHDRLIVTRLHESHPTRMSRLRRALSAGECVLVLGIENGDDWALKSALGLVPQSLRMSADHSERHDQLLVYLQKAGIHRIELLGIEDCPEALFETLRASGRSIDILISQARDLRATRGGATSVLKTSELSSAAPTIVAKLPWWSELMHPGDRVLVSDSLALSAARHALAEAQIEIEPIPCCTAPEDRDRTQSAEPWPGLAVLAPLATGAVTRFIEALRDHVARMNFEIPILVIGATLNDLALLGGGGVFATGPVPEKTLARVLRTYGCETLVLLDREGLFHRLETARAWIPGPVCYVDWSGGTHLANPGDLALDPALDDAQSVEQIVGWYRAITKRAVQPSAFAP